MTDFMSNFTATLEQANFDNDARFRRIQELEDIRRERLANRSTSLDSEDRRSARERIIQENQSRQSPRRSSANISRTRPQRSASFNVSEPAINVQQERDTFRTAFEEARSTLFGPRPPAPEEPSVALQILNRRSSDAGRSGASSSSNVSTAGVSRSRHIREELGSSLGFQEALASVARSVVPSSSRATNYQRYRMSSSERPSRYARRILGIADQEDNSSEASDGSFGDHEVDRISDAGSDRGSTTDLRATAVRNSARRRGTRYQSDLTSLSSFISSRSVTPRQLELDEEETLPVLGLSERLPFVDDKGKIRWIKRSFVNKSGAIPVPVIKNKSQPQEVEEPGETGPSETIANDEEDPQKRYQRMRELLYKRRFNTDDKEANDSPDGPSGDVSQDTNKMNGRTSKGSECLEVSVEIDDDRFPAHKSYYVKPRPRPSLDIYKASRIRHESDSEFVQTEEMVVVTRQENATESAASDVSYIPQVDRPAGEEIRRSQSQQHSSGHVQVLSPIQSPRLLQQDSTGEVMSEADTILEQLQQMHVNAELPLDTSHLDVDELRMIQKALEESATPPESPSHEEVNSYNYSGNFFTVSREGENEEDVAFVQVPDNHLYIMEEGDQLPNTQVSQDSDRSGQTGVTEMNGDYSNSSHSNHDNTESQNEEFMVTEEFTTSLTREQMEAIYRNMRRHSSSRNSSTSQDVDLR